MKVDDVKIGMQVDFKVYDDYDEDDFWITGNVVNKVNDGFDVFAGTHGEYLLYAAEMEPHDESRFQPLIETLPLPQYIEDLLKDAIFKTIGEGFVHGTTDSIEYTNMTSEEFWNAVKTAYRRKQQKK